MIMTRPFRFLATLAIGAACVSALTACSQSGNSQDGLATGRIIGLFGHVTGRATTQSYGFTGNLVVPGAKGDPAASTAFGVMDSGQVVWMGTTAYLPSLQFVFVKRSFQTPEPPLKPEQTPRYLMVCSWPLDAGGHQAGPITHGYAERNDSRSSVVHDTASDSIDVAWESVPAQRVMPKISKVDYCGDVAQGRAPAAPAWMQDRKE